jgi:LPXTG-motif cell wall-anchored protein
MIQRIQSVYLLLTSLLSVLFLKGNILVFKKEISTEIVMNIKGAYQLTATGSLDKIQNQIPALIILATILLLSLAAIFFYRKRKLQMKLTLGVIALIIAFIATLLFYTVSIINKYQAVVVVGYKMFIPLLMIMFGILACKGIRKDEELVKSYDRLR